MTTPEIACGINVYCSGPDDSGLAEAMKDMARLGYSHIAYGPMDPSATDISGLKHMMADAGIRPIAMAGLTPTADISSPDERVRRGGLDLLKGTVDFAHELGADQLNGVSYAVFGDRAEPFGPTRWEASANLLGQAADYANSAGITMTFEVVNRYETAMLNTAAQAMEFVIASGSDHLFIHLDTYHMAIEEASMADAIRLALPRLRHLELGQSGRGSLITGAVDVAAVVRDARAAGYQGRFALEAFSRQLLSPEGGNDLAIWRETYADPHAIAAEAIDIVRKAYAD